MLSDTDLIKIFSLFYMNQRNRIHFGLCLSMIYMNNMHFLEQADRLLKHRHIYQYDKTTENNDKTDFAYQYKI